MVFLIFFPYFYFFVELCWFFVHFLCQNFKSGMAGLQLRGSSRWVQKNEKWVLTAIEWGLIFFLKKQWGGFQMWIATKRGFTLRAGRYLSSSNSNRVGVDFFLKKQWGGLQIYTCWTATKGEFTLGAEKWEMSFNRNRVGVDFFFEKAVRWISNVDRN